MKDAFTTMAKGTVKRATRNNTMRREQPSTPQKDFDAGIKAQLEQYGLELSDVVAVLEEDPSMLQYVEQGAKGNDLAKTCSKYNRQMYDKKGKCLRGVETTIAASDTTTINAGFHSIPREKNNVGTMAGSNSACNTWQACENVGDYFTVTYHTAETDDILKHSPKGTIISWENQDAPGKRVNSGGLLHGHVTVKRSDVNSNSQTAFLSDFPESVDSLHRTVFQNGIPSGTPRYGSLTYISFPKDVTFSPELIQLAQERKKERETERVIQPIELPKQPDDKKMTAFLSQNPRLGYLMLKKVNPKVSHDLSVDGGKNLIKYYNELPINSEERAALNLLVNKGIKNTMDYAAVNTALNEVNDEIFKLKNPIAYEKRQPATEQQMQHFCNATPNYAYQLQQGLGIEAHRMNSRELSEHIANLNPCLEEYKAMNALAKKELSPETDAVNVKLAVANVAKDFRSVTEAELNSLFENTPALVYYVQKEFGTEKKGGIRVTSELHSYYNQLPIDAPERKAIDELAIAHIETSDLQNVNPEKAIYKMVASYLPEKSNEPRIEVALDLPNPDDIVLAQPYIGTRNEGEEKSPEDRAAIRAGFEKMDSGKWADFVSDYLKSSVKDDNLNKDLKVQRKEAEMRFNTTLQSLFKDNGNGISSKESMRKSSELLDEYLRQPIVKGCEKSLEGFIKFIESGMVKTTQTKEKGLTHILSSTDFEDVKRATSVNRNVKNGKRENLSPIWMRKARESARN